MKPCPRRQQASSSQTKLGRRTFVGGMTAGVLTGGVWGCGRFDASNHFSRQDVYGRQGRGQAPIASSTSDQAMPGLFPGRVVEVAHGGSTHEGKRDRAAVRSMIKYGMQQLVPDAEHAVDAWRKFFTKGDRVGIKVVPVGKVPLPGANPNIEASIVDLERPGSISSYEVVLEVIDSLVAAGVRLSDIMVFERYRNDFIQAGYVDILPDGVHWECSSVRYDGAQLEIDGQIRGETRHRNVAGYDRDVFRELPFCQPPDVHDPRDDRRFRSHLSRIVTQKVDKIISIPVLKDHRSAGVTLALKNMSHGLVNNVARSHVKFSSDPEARGESMNHCQTFIPAAVSLPPTREKCVLQILDGLLGTYEGGPGAWNKSFSTWEHKSLLFSTDPVALDHVGWEILDTVRAQRGWPAVARMGLDGETNVKPEITRDDGTPACEQFHIRQPQHVPLAALLGLGVFDKDDITHQRFEIG